MIQKIDYYFSTNTFTSETNDNLDEIKRQAREYIKQNNEKCFIFRNERCTVVDGHGDLIYNSRSTIREFDAESEVNADV